MNVNRGQTKYGNNTLSSMTGSSAHGQLRPAASLWVAVILYSVHLGALGVPQLILHHSLLSVASRDGVK